MSATVDFIVVIALLYLAVRGWLKGLTRTLIGPLSLVFSIAAGMLYFDRTHNFIHAGLIMVFGPVVIAIAASIIVAMWHKTVDRDTPTTWPSRLAGSICNICWGGLIVALLLVFTAIAPSSIVKLSSIKEGVANSRTYALLNVLIKGRISYVDNVENLFEAVDDPDKMAEIQSTPEFNAVYNDEKVQELLSEEESMEQIRNKDFIKLMSNPRLQAVLQDEDLVKKIMGMYTEKQTKSTLEPPPPKVYEIDGDKLTIIQ